MADLPYQSPQGIHIADFGDIGSGETVYIDRSKSTIRRTPTSPPIHNGRLADAIHQGWLTPVPAEPEEVLKVEPEPPPTPTGRTTEGLRSPAATRIRDKLLERPDLALDVRDALLHIPFAAPWDRRSTRGGDGEPTSSIRPLLHPVCRGTADEPPWAAHITKRAHDYTLALNLTADLTWHANHVTYHPDLKDAEAQADEQLQKAGYVLLHHTDDLPPSYRPTPPATRAASPWTPAPADLPHPAAQRRALRYMMGTTQDGELVATDTILAELVELPSDHQAHRIRWTAWPQGNHQATTPTTTGEQRAKDATDFDRAWNNARTLADNSLHDAGWELAETNPPT
jgi:hypothetical protein